MEYKGPLDLNALAKLRAIGRQTGKDLVGELIGMFLNKEPAVLEEILGAAARGDAVSLHETAHQLRSSAGTMGALCLFDLCEEVEDLAESGSLEAVPEALSRLQTEFGQVCRALEVERDRPADG